MTRSRRWRRVSLHRPAAARSGRRRPRRATQRADRRAHPGRPPAARGSRNTLRRNPLRRSQKQSRRRAAPRRRRMRRRRRRRLVPGATRTAPRRSAASTRAFSATNKTPSGLSAGRTALPARTRHTGTARTGLAWSLVHGPRAKCYRARRRAKIVQSPSVARRPACSATRRRRVSSHRARLPARKASTSPTPTRTLGLATSWVLPRSCRPSGSRRSALRQGLIAATPGAAPMAACSASSGTTTGASACRTAPSAP
mmetsp:Transcript_117696/g.340277  ORF Transcript_117696/g.340277 Transcript_117696/m.340277 type:complete len:255 (+) Transcript_117696:327-1091(+)